MFPLFSENVSHDFKLEIEIYYTVSSDSPANRQLGLPVKRPVRRSASGQVEGPKYILAGHCQLTVDNIHDTITTHDLKTGAKLFFIINIIIIIIVNSDKD